MIDLWLWLSPWDTYQTIDTVAAAALKVHMDGMTTGVLIPTLYDDWPQSQLSNTLGPELKVSGLIMAQGIRAGLEAQGIACGGWSVPRATGDVHAEGYAHGQIACAFDYFMLNFEAGWPGFWTGDGPGVVNTWLGAFWEGVAAGGGTQQLSGNVGVTMVTNAGMMGATDDTESAAWIGGSNFDALESYIPGDPGLDPANSLRIWNERLSRLGVSGRSVVPIMENGDLPAQVKQFADVVHGAQIWTLANASAQLWPDLTPPVPDPAPDPVPVDPCADAVAARDGLTSALGYIAFDLLQPVVALGAAQAPSVQGLIDGIRAQADQHGITRA